MAVSQSRATMGKHGVLCAISPLRNFIISRSMMPSHTIFMAACRIMAPGAVRQKFWKMGVFGIFTGKKFPLVMDLIRSPIQNAQIRVIRKVRAAVCFVGIWRPARCDSFNRNSRRTARLPIRRCGLTGMPDLQSIHLIVIQFISAVSLCTNQQIAV